jgi:hypothetical protein
VRWGWSSAKPEFAGRSLGEQFSDRLQRSDLAEKSNLSQSARNHKEDRRFESPLLSNESLRTAVHVRNRGLGGYRCLPDDFLGLRGAKKGEREMPRYHKVAWPLGLMLAAMVAATTLAVAAQAAQTFLTPNEFTCSVRFLFSTTWRAAEANDEEGQKEIAIEHRPSQSDSHLFADRGY